MSDIVLRAGTRYELKMRKKAYKSLRSQFSYLKKHIQEIYAKPSLWAGYRGKEIDNINDFFTNMGIYSLEDDIYGDVKSVALSGYRGRSMVAKDDMENFGLKFNKNNPAITAYMDEWSKLQLSDMAGSIAGTTKRGVISILQDGFSKGASSSTIAKKINALDSTLFSMNRAKIIAINETGKSFEYGNALPMYEISKKGGDVEKMRQNMHDAKVSQQCVDDNAVGWIKFIQKFPSGNDIPPGHVNCRCHTQYKVL